MKELIGKTMPVFLCCLLAGPAAADRLFFSGPLLREELPITGQFPGVGNHVHPLCRVEIPSAQAGQQFTVTLTYSGTNDSWLYGPNRGAMLSSSLWFCEPAPNRGCIRMDRQEGAGMGPSRHTMGGANLIADIHHDLRSINGAFELRYARGPFTIELMARSASKWLNKDRPSRGKGKRDKSREHLDIHACSGWVQRITPDPLPD